jgi:hypothetical protein
LRAKGVRTLARTLDRPNARSLARSLTGREAEGGKQERETKQAPSPQERMPPNASTPSRLLYENDDVEHLPRFEKQGA